MMRLKRLCVKLASIALALSVIALGACRQTPPDGQGTPATEDADSGGAAEGGESPTEAPPDDDSVEGEVVELTLGPGDVNVFDPAAGLDALDSYRATLTVSFDGTADGEASQWTRTRTITKANNPPLLIEQIEGALPAGEPLPAPTVKGTQEPPALEDPVTLIAVIEGTVYEVDAGGGCISYPVTDEALPGEPSATRHPAAVLPPVYGAEQSGMETVSGIETTHAAFGAPALGMPGITDAQGEVWVAGDGLVMRYHLTVTAGPDVLGEGSEGTISYEYEVNEINPVVAADLPISCPQGEVSAPTPPDAQSAASAPGSLSFDSATSVEEIAAFYQSELPAAGWTPAQDPQIGEAGTMLIYTQGEQELVIFIEGTDAGTHVQITEQHTVMAAPALGTPGVTPTP